jgi:hypothetical protein
MGNLHSAARDRELRGVVSYHELDIVEKPVSCVSLPFALRCSYTRPTQLATHDPLTLPFRVT